MNWLAEESLLRMWTFAKCLQYVRGITWQSNTVSIANTNVEWFKREQFFFMCNQNQIDVFANDYYRCNALFGVSRSKFKKINHKTEWFLAVQSTNFHAVWLLPKSLPLSLALWFFLFLSQSLYSSFHSLCRIWSDELWTSQKHTLLSTDCIWEYGIDMFTRHARNVNLPPAMCVQVCVIHTKSTIRPQKHKSYALPYITHIVCQMQGVWWQ